ncbi:MAG: hypothetical protein SFV54_20605 [Bryobacteraceae bacterium]|nr:hypothetical protein [Bryobacteraceae bacterium]
MNLRGAAAARTLAVAAWLGPCLFCLWVYWYGLKAWFQQDDFAWLFLRQHVEDWGSFFHSMFAPMAQGSIRPWSERGFFMLFHWLFGMEALPYRIWVFATQFANIALLGSVARKLTGRWVAGVLAPILWIANPALGVPMSWTSAYNQILCAFFILAAFRLFLAYVETGRARYYWLQFGVFVLGFGANELNVVYPALAAAYAVLCSRKHVARTLPLVAVSVLYFVLHRAVAPVQPEGSPYRMHFDAALPATLLTYWQWVLGAGRFVELKPQPAWFVPAATAIFTLPMATYVAMRAARRDLTPLFCLAWFLIVLAPVLPLRRHVTDYYLVIPSIGLAILAAGGLAGLARRSNAGAAAACAVVFAYLYLALPVSRGVARWHFDRGRKVRTLALGVARAGEIHKGKTVLLTGVEDDIFWAGVYDRPFRLYGMAEVYLAPGAERSILPHPEIGPIDSYVLSPALARRALEREMAVVYAVENERLRNVTTHFRNVVMPQWRAETPRFVDAGQRLFDDLLGAGWYELETGQRWSGPKATLRIGGPRVSTERLLVTGFLPDVVLKDGPVPIRVIVEGRVLPFRDIPAAGAFAVEWTLPPETVGKEALELTVESGRPYRAAGDERPLGFVFGTFAVR